MLLGLYRGGPHPKITRRTALRRSGQAVAAAALVLVIPSLTAEAAHKRNFRAKWKFRKSKHDTTLTPDTTPTPSGTLTPSAPITVTKDSQIVEDFHITADGQAGVTVSGFKNVILRSLKVDHKNGAGLDITHADNILIEDVEVNHVGAPTIGANSTASLLNIQLQAIHRPTVRRARLTRGSSGIYLLGCTNVRLEMIEGHDFRGPFPRGQCVQFNKCTNALLEDFSSECPGETSWTEDNISVYQSSHIIIRKGLVDGNNSPSGAGVMVERGSGKATDVLFEDVDAIHQGNGCFSAYPADNVIFRRVRARDNICAGQQGRDAPLSNSLVFAGSPDSTGLKLEEAKYFNLCNPRNVLWKAAVFTVIDKTEEDFVPRNPVRLVFPWAV